MCEISYSGELRTKGLINILINPVSRDFVNLSFCYFIGVDKNYLYDLFPMALFCKKVYIQRPQIFVLLFPIFKNRNKS